MGCCPLVNVSHRGQEHLPVFTIVNCLSKPSSLHFISTIFNHLSIIFLFQPRPWLCAFLPSLEVFASLLQLRHRLPLALFSRHATSQAHPLLLISIVIFKVLPVPWFTFPIPLFVLSSSPVWPFRPLSPSVSSQLLLLLLQPFGPFLFLFSCAPPLLLTVAILFVRLWLL